jgi:hypothetical protein
MKNTTMNPDPGGEVGVVKRVLFEKVTVVNSLKNCQSNSISVSGLYVNGAQTFFLQKCSNFTENPGGEEFH